MKDTPEPFTDKELFLIAIALIVVVWGIAVLVDAPFFQRLLQFLSMAEEFDGEMLAHQLDSATRWDDDESPPDVPHLLGQRGGL